MMGNPFKKRNNNWRAEVVLEQEEIKEVVEGQKQAYKKLLDIVVKRKKMEEYMQQIELEKREMSVKRGKKVRIPGSQTTTQLKAFRERKK